MRLKYQIEVDIDSVTGDIWGLRLVCPSRQSGLLDPLAALSYDPAEFSSVGLALESIGEDIVTHVTHVRH